MADEVLERSPGEANASAGYQFARTTGWPSLKDLWCALMSPLQLQPRSLRVELAPMFMVFAFALMIYGITTPREIALEDDGLFLMNLYSFGVGHPPGYPLYTLLGSPFFHLLPDFLSPAYRGHMFSGFAGAVACMAIYMITAQLVRNRFCAVAAGMAYAVSEAFWSQAIIAEVYTLNAAIYFWVMALCLRYGAYRPGQDIRSHRMLYVVIAFIYGLGLTNHWPLMGLGGVALLLLVISQWRSLLRRMPVGLVFLALGLLPYLWMVLRSHSETLINFYGPIYTLKELFFYIMRDGYAQVDNQAGVGLPEKIQFAMFFAGETGRQITLLGIAIAMLGWITMLRTTAHCALAVVFFIGWFMTGMLLVILIDFKTEFIWFSAFRVYHLLSYGIVAILFGYGLAWLGDWVRNRLPVRAGRFAAPGMTAVAAIAVVSGSVAVHWHQNDRSDYTWARDLALYRLAAVEPNTLLFTFDDLDLPVGYLNMVERVRPDIEVFNDQALVFNNRFFSPFYLEKERIRQLSEYIIQTDPRPVYYHPYRQEFFDTPKQGSDLLGFWRRVNRDDDTDRIVLSESLRYWAENNLAVGEYSDRWTKQQAQGVISTLIGLINQAAQRGYQLSPEWIEVIEQAYNQNPLTHMSMLWHAALNGRIGQARAHNELRWINQLFEKKEEVIFDNKVWTDVLYLKAQMLRKYPELSEIDPELAYEETLLETLDYTFHRLSMEALASYYRSKFRHDDMLKLLTDRFPDISVSPVYVRQLHNLILREKKEGKLLAPVIQFT